MRDMKNVDLAIVKAITEIRQKNQACTARAVANQLRMSPDVVRYRCDNLKREDIVTWTPMPGSLRVLAPQPAKPAAEQPAPEPVEQKPVVQPGVYHCRVCDRMFKGPAMLGGHLRSKAHLAAEAMLSVST